MSFSLAYLFPGDPLENLTGLVPQNEMQREALTRQFKLDGPYLIQFFQHYGFKQKTGKTMTNGAKTIHFPRPQSNLAVSAYDDILKEPNINNFYCLTPTQFAEVLFNLLLDKEKAVVVNAIKSLIDKCPYNIEWLRDISYHSKIEQITIDTFSELTQYQKQVIEQKFKRKKAL